MDQQILQFYHSNSIDYSVTSGMETPIQAIQTTSSLEENDIEFKEVLLDGKKYHSCAYAGCGKMFRYKSEFMRHKVIHTPERPLDCPFEGCTKTFKREDALKSHLRTHTGETPYKCEDPGCGQGFSSKAALRYHSLKHKKEKGYECSFPGCNRRFLTLSQMKQHERALNYHQKASTQGPTLEEEEEPSPVKAIKHEDVSSDRSTVPDTNHVEWGIKVENEAVQGEKVRQNFEEEFEKMVKSLILENNAIKMKLNMLYTFRGMVQGNKNPALNLKQLMQSSTQGLPKDKNFDFVKLESQ